MGIKRASIIACFLLALISCISCDDNGVFNSYQSMENATWERNEPAKFVFLMQDTVNRHNLFFSLRNNHEYAYSNLFLIAEMHFPDGKKVVDTLEYEMTDSRGKFLGTGLSSIKESKLFYKENSIFPVEGEYKVNISQAMRKSGEVKGIKELKGITDVGLRIEKVSKK